MDLTPEQAEALIGQSVHVQLANGTTCTGFFYTTDPVSGNIILVQDSDATVIMKPSMVSITPTTDNVGLDAGAAVQSGVRYTLDAAWLTERRDRLIALLEKQCIPFRHEPDDPVIHVLGRARVDPPYVPTSVVSESVVIRNRVRALVMENNLQVY